MRTVKVDLMQRLWKASASSCFACARSSRGGSEQPNLMKRM